MYEDFANMYGGNVIDLIVMIAITYAVLFAVSMALYLIVKIGMPRSALDKKVKRKRFFRTVFNGSLAGSFIAFVIYWFISSGLGMFCSLFLYGGLIGIARYFAYRIKSG